MDKSVGVWKDLARISCYIINKIGGIYQFSPFFGGRVNYEFWSCLEFWLKLYSIVKRGWEGEVLPYWLEVRGVGEGGGSTQQWGALKQAG